MRGKHANSAANRRDRTELEQRAITAEHRAERLEKELAELREASQRQINGLRAELSQSQKERDSSAAPALAQAEEQIRALMEKRREADEHRQTIQENWRAFTNNVVGVLKGMGFTNVEAVEVLLASTMPDGSARTFYDGPKPKSVEQVVTVERARGQRGAVDLLADRKPSKPTSASKPTA